MLISQSAERVTVAARVCKGSQGAEVIKASALCHPRWRDVPESTRHQRRDHVPCCQAVCQRCVRHDVCGMVMPLTDVVGQGCL